MWIFNRDDTHYFSLTVYFTPVCSLGLPPARLFIGTQLTSADYSQNCDGRRVVTYGLTTDNTGKRAVTQRLNAMVEVKSYHWERSPKTP